jgi:hypothetical protein
VKLRRIWRSQTESQLSQKLETNCAASRTSRSSSLRDEIDLPRVPFRIRHHLSCFRRDRQSQCPHSLPSLPLVRASLPAGEKGRGGHRSRVSWESGRETVREAPGEGEVSPELESAGRNQRLRRWDSSESTGWSDGVVEYGSRQVAQKRVPPFNFLPARPVIVAGLRSNRNWRRPEFLHAPVVRK